MAGFTDSGDEAPERRGAQDLDPATLAAFRGPDETDEEFDDSMAEIAAEVGALAPKNTPKADKAKDEAAGDAAAVDADDPPATEEEKTKLETALEALRRDGWSEEELNKLARKTILSKGLKRAKVQADTDEMQADLRRIKAEREKATAKPDESAQPAQTSADLAALSKALSEDGISEGVSKALGQFLQARDQKHQEETTALRQALIAMHIRDARREVADSFPDLKKSEVWDETLEMAQFLESKEPGQEPEFYLRKAATKLKLAPAVDKARAEEARAESRARRNGSPEVNGRKATATPDPAEDEFQAWASRLRAR